MLMQKLNKMICFNKANKDIQLIFYPILVSERVRKYRRAFLTQLVELIYSIAF